MEGTIKFLDLRSVRNRESMLVVMSRKGEIALLDEEGRERKRYPVVYGAKLAIEEGARVKEGQLIAEWDPYTIPIITEVPGLVKFGDITEGITMQEQVDAVTGHAHKVIVESKDPDLRPRISIKQERMDSAGKRTMETEARYILPIGSNIYVKEGDPVAAGDVLVKIPRETTKTKDITGGLPRVAELFEARKPKEYALISEIDGVVSFGKMVKGKRKVIVTPEVGEPKEYAISKGKHISVHEGDVVKAGEPLMDGSSNPHDILKVLGDKELARFLVDEIQEVYQLQGVKINDKHIEIIVRQMLKRVKIREVGDTRFIVDEQVEEQIFKEENERVLKEGGSPATADPLFLGITKASLITDSWVSAASFQETTRVLTQAAIEGKIDTLRGLKENVIMGRLVPAGTGNPRYREIRPVVEGGYPLPLDTMLPENSEAKEQEADLTAAD